MSKNKLAALTVAALFAHQTAAAVDFVGVGKIAWVENGWDGEGVAFKHSGIGIGGCPVSTEFAIDKNHPGYKEIVAIALAAHSSSADVELVVEKGACLMGGRTKVLAVKISK